MYSFTRIEFLCMFARTMRLLVDDAVSTEFPGFAETVSHLRPEWEFLNFRARLGSNNLFESLDSHLPDVVVVDSKWLIIGAPILISLLKKAGLARAKTLVTASNLDNVTKILAAHNGFSDVISNGAQNETLVEKIDKNLNGDSDLDKDELWNLVKRPALATIDTPIAESDVDRAIIELLRIGIPDIEIAEALMLSGQTIRNRVSAMLQRDGFTNRTQLSWAYTNQILVERSSENPLWRT